MSESVTQRQRLLLQATLLILAALSVAAFPEPLRPMAIAILAILLAVSAYRLKNYHLSILALAYFARVVLVLVDSYLHVLPTPPIARSHNVLAQAVADGVLHGTPFSPLAGAGPMRTVVAVVLSPFYLVLGGTPISGRLGVAFFSLLLGYIAYHIVRRISSRDIALASSALVLFWPTILYRSIVIQREILLAVLMLVVVWVGIQWLDEFHVTTVIIGIIAAGLTVALRPENVVLVGTVLVCSVILRDPQDIRYLLYGTLVGIPVLAYVAFNFGALTGYGQMISPAIIDVYAHGRAHGDAAYLVTLHYRSWLDILLYAPIKVIYFLYTPFPWQVREPVELFAGVSAWMLLLACLVGKWGVAFLNRAPKQRGVLLSYLSIGVLTYSIIEMNYGAAVRRRIQFVPVIILIAVIGLSKLRVQLRTASPGGKTELNRTRERSQR